MTFGELTIRMPDDFHAHFREEASTDINDVLLKDVVPYTARMASRGLAMPNTKRPIGGGRDVERYYPVLKRAGGPGFEPLMAVKLTQRSTPRDVQEWKDAGVTSIKLMPEGVTTNSDDAVTDIRRLDDTLHAAREAGLVLCVHAETPGAFCLDRESHYCQGTVPYLASIGGRVVIEHLTSDVGVQTVEKLGPNVAGTITPQHLRMTLDNVIGHGIRPHNFCLPVAKYPSDQRALIRAATSGNPKFFLGTDTAPHVREKKERAIGCAGVFVAPVAMSILVQVFDDQGALDKLEDFTSRFGAEFYGLSLNTGRLTLLRRRWTVPALYFGRVVPFLSGEMLEYDIAT